MIVVQQALSVLVFCGRHGRWILPLGLLAGGLLPAAAEPMKAAIPYCIAALLFLAVLRLSPGNATAQALGSGRAWFATTKRVLLAQLVLPLLVFVSATVAGLPALWVLAATLVAAAPPISGSPNLVLLLRGDGSTAMRWLMLGTALLPISCLPVLYLLFPAQSITIMFRPSLVLLALIGTSVALALIVVRESRKQGVTLSPPVLDGLSAIVLAVMVVGLMSALHDPAMQWSDLAQALAAAVIINVGLQCLGVWLARLMKLSREKAIAQGVGMGNRNIALFLTALPMTQMEPLLLFIACYQVPMYLTPLVGELFYKRLE